MAFPLLAGFSYACYFVFSKPLARNAAPGSVMMVLCLLSGLCMLPVFWIYPAAWLATPMGALVALHLGVVTTAIAFSLTLAGLKVTPAATASTLSLAEPLSAACLGIFFLHEPLSLSAAVGIALIFGSVLILVACPSGQPPRESAAAWDAPRRRARPGQAHAVQPGALKRSSPTRPGRHPARLRGHPVEQASQPAAFSHRFPCREAVLNRMPGRDAPRLHLPSGSRRTGPRKNTLKGPGLHALSRDSELA